MMANCCGIWIKAQRSSCEEALTTRHSATNILEARHPNTLAGEVCFPEMQLVVDCFE